MTETLRQIPPFNTYLGTIVEAVADGHARVTLELAPHHLNTRGVVHGGVISSLLDSALGAAVISAIPASWWCATTSLSVQFLEGAREGLLVAEGRVTRRGRRVAFAAGEVHDAGGRLVAHAQGSWHLWPQKPEERAGEAFVAMRGTGERLPVHTIVCVGRNYAEHVREMGGAPAAEPVLFLKPVSALVHDGGAVVIPEGAGAVHHEVELVAVIGARTRNVSPERALEHVHGYAVGLDMTLRDLQGAAKKKGEPWAVAKGFDTSAPVSAVAPREDVGDARGLGIRLTVNGEVRQEDTTSSMLHDVAALVSTVSRHFTLDRGDLVFTGTPSGVGPVRPGDVLEASIERVGAVRVRVEG